MKKILLIEDNPEMLENLTEILELANYEAITATNGKDGVTKAKTHLPDLIVSDIMMPELDGFGVLNILSKDENTKNIPFIFLTAKTEKIDFRKGMSMGADDYLTKPFEDTELLDAIEVRLKKHDDKQLLNQRAAKTFEEIIAESRLFKFKKKEFIYKEFAQSDYLYYLQTGKVKIYKTSELGKELITDVHVEKEIFGYNNIIDNSNHTDNAVAMENSEVYLIEKSKFLEFILWNKNNSSEFLSLLTANLKEKEAKLVNLAYNSVRKRVAEQLRELNLKFNDGKPNGEVSLSREDFANLVGTATETLIRTLSDFQDEGIIETMSGKIRIKDLVKLENMRN